MERRPLAQHREYRPPPVWPWAVPAVLLPFALIGLIVMINWAERL